MSALDINAIAALRARLWDSGFRPLAVLNADHPTGKGKAPLGKDWHVHALSDPPEAVRLPPVAHARNTGVLCDGLRAVDIDVDEPNAAAAVRSLAIEMLGEAPLRWRANSPRALLVYRAATGEPPKRSIVGQKGKVEILGHGQQFVAFGTHDTGADLRWLPESLYEFSREALPAVTEEQVETFLERAASMIGADAPAQRQHVNGEDRHPNKRPQADLLDVAAALACIPNDGPPNWEAWNRVGMATWAATGGAMEGFSAWLAWSAKNEAHKVAACRERWAHYLVSPPAEIGAGTLFHMAKQARSDWHKPTETTRNSGSSARGAAAAALHVVNPADLDGVPVPERLWIVADWLGISHVTGQYGDGGVGKGMCAQQLQTACATRTPWLGLAVMRCPSLGFYSEDDDDELHRRQERICRAFNLRLADLGDMRWISGVGQDNTLCTFDSSGRMHVTDRFYQLEEAAKAHSAKLIALDNAADLFGGNENDRNQVRRFVGLLTRLGIDCGAAVLLNAHPSRAGLASGSLDGGNTAWNNSMRSRWGLAKPKDEDADNGERILTRHKANYAPDGGTLRLRWAGGVLVPITRDGGIAGVASRAACEETFLTLLDRTEAQGIFVSESERAPNYAPKTFAQRPDREGYTRREFEHAMAALFTAKRIRVTEYRNAHRHTRSRVVRDEPRSDGTP